MTRHGLTAGGTPAWFYRWMGMMKRCYDPRERSYPRYGGRGISVCERWHDPKNFLADMGEPPEGMSLDRINNAGNYEPSNCRWADLITQASNTSINKYVEINGIRDTQAGWARRLGVSPATILRRLRDFPPEIALTKPVRRVRARGAVPPASLDRTRTS